MTREEKTKSLVGLRLGTLICLLMISASFRLDQNEVNKSYLNCTLEVYEQVDSVIQQHLPPEEYIKVRDSIEIDYKVALNREDHTYTVTIRRMAALTIDVKLLENKISQLDHSCMWETGDAEWDAHKAFMIYFSPTTIDNIKNSRK